MTTNAQAKSVLYLKTNALLVYRLGALHVFYFSYFVIWCTAVETTFKNTTPPPKKKILMNNFKKFPLFYLFFLERIQNLLFGRSGNRRLIIILLLLIYIYKSTDIITG